MHRLQEVKRHYDQESIPVTKHHGITTSINACKNIHSLRPTRSVQPHQDERRRGMENSFSNEIRTLRVPGNAIRTYECTSDMSSTHQQCSQSALGYIRHRILG